MLERYRMGGREVFYFIQSSRNVFSSGVTFRTRVLLICDGSNSYLGQKLGYVHGPADSVCSHQYGLISESIVCLWLNSLML